MDSMILKVFSNQNESMILRPGQLLEFHEGIQTDVLRAMGMMLSGHGALEQVHGPKLAPSLGPKPGTKPASFARGCSPNNSSANGVPCSRGVTLSLSCRYFCGLQSQGTLWHTGISSTAARCQEPSFHPTQGLSTHFQTSLILSHLQISMKSFRFDTQSSSETCAIPSSLFWNLAWFWFGFIFLIQA